jgi:HPt (histidine-containing phosphotransfer) domain-containing protein
MTAHAMAGDREKSIEAGMNDHVTKPIEPHDLFGALVKWIKPRDRSDVKTFPKISKKAVEGKTEKEMMSSGLPGISIKSGISKVGGNKKLYRKLLGKFLESNVNTVERIRNALDKGDTEVAARLAHTVKGVAGNLGANDLFSIAAALEKATKKGETESLGSLIENFRSHLDVVMDSIQTLKEGEPEGKEKEEPIDVNIVKPLLKEITELLESDLMEAVNRLEALRKHLEYSEVHEQFKRLEKRMEGFDTDKAKEILNEISEILKITPAQI